MAAKTWPPPSTQMPTSWAINQAVPGLSGLTSSASGIIQNALSGIPSPSLSRLSNAYFGAGSGMDPTSDFLRNRGFDLYRTQAQGQQRQGIQDLATLLGSTAGTVAPTPGQELQNTQAQRSLAEQSSQFSQNLGFEREQYNKQLELLNKYLGGGGGGGSPLAYEGGIPNAMDSSLYTGYYQPPGSQAPRLPATGYNPWSGQAAPTPSLGWGRNVGMMG